MKGHQGVIKMRLAKRKPEWVFLNDFPCETDWEHFGDLPTVSTSGDAVAGLDLRFLVGVNVSLAGYDEARLKAIFERCKEHAALVAVCHTAPGVSAWKQNGWMEVWNHA